MLASDIARTKSLSIAKSAAVQTQATVLFTTHTYYKSYFIFIHNSI